ncbi:Polysaccharide biosynthesis protein [Hartmannibacter diazotrophicus]|uniref:Polysaccharide biosynthesis protein n=1 Tax=Hartmannibacter diazotrophicus TaxID=1482074 RepID=A0A2C9D3J9_9HYPH|nr:polysaccharide biosynthesis C-terminal domain-containing protein [Hartmannibacter diazotrophicus]SON54803.1 Polysaccharide biosynthesis protein [Hartmannibacter diazotrophicus]
MTEESQLIGSHPGEKDQSGLRSSLQGLLAMARAYIADKGNHGIFGVMLLKVASAVASILFLSVSARALGSYEFGRFAVWFSLASIASVVAVFGQELLIVRTWNEYVASRRWALAKGALLSGFVITIGMSLLVGLALFVFQDEQTGDIVFAAGLGIFLVINTLQQHTSYAARAIVNIFVASGHREITWRLLVVVVLIGMMIGAVKLTAGELFLISAACIGVAFVIQCVAIWRAVPGAVRAAKAEYAREEWISRSWKMWLSTIMESLNQYIEVLIVGYLIDPVAAGAYFFASRLANSFALAADSVGTFGTRHVPRLYYAQKHEELAQIMYRMAQFTAIIVGAGIVGVLLFGKLALWLCGPEYVSQFPILLVLSIGTAAAAAAGPAPAILMLTGHEGRYLTIIASSVALRCLGFYLLIPHFGTMGAAISTAVTFVGITLFINSQCRKLTGLDPSVAQLMKKV